MPLVQWWRARQVANAVNGSTLLGLAVAVVTRADLSGGPRGWCSARVARLPDRGATAVTFGDVVLTRRDEAWLRDRPRLLAHEERHSWQYVACLGLPLLPLYVVMAGWSYVRGGDFGVHNPFERLAGLEDGGYPTLSARERRRRQAA